MTAPVARQLALELPHRVAMSRADFLVGDGNRAALQVIERWPDWPERGVLLVGPPGSGKTHLVEIWCAETGGGRIAAADLSDAVAGAAEGALAVEDLHAGPVGERALFHLLNGAAEGRVRLLLTSRLTPGALAIGLPDLASRLRAIQPVEIAPPDDNLLRRVLLKLFADRQLAVDPGMIDFIALRMERSLDAASRLVERLDREALAGGGAITRRLVAELLGQSEDAPETGGDP